MDNFLSSVLRLYMWRAMRRCFWFINASIGKSIQDFSGKDIGNLELDFLSQSVRRDNERFSGTAFRRHRFVRNHRRVANFAKFLSRLDGLQLAFVCQHFFCFERSPLHARVVSALYFNGARGGEKLVGECSFYCLGSSVSVVIYRSIRQRLVGFLIIRKKTLIFFNSFAP